MKVCAYMGPGRRLMTYLCWLDISDDGSHPSHLAEEIDQIRDRNKELWEILDAVRQENLQVFLSCQKSYS